MQFSDFKLMPVPMQAHFICSKGVLLGERTEGNAIVALYAVELFYVEVYYRAADSDILKLLSFHDTSFLEPYLGHITIADVVRASFYPVLATMEERH